MKIELYYFDECPSYKTALKYIDEALKEKGLNIPVEMVRITSEEDAVRHRFLGSPSVRIDGVDIEPGTEKIKAFSLTCRLYLEDDNVLEWPGRKLIRQAIDNASAKQ
ncbi:MAG: DUF2703 domain-containing protein [Dehalococcoidales bacterium]|jgi:hypothetical protein